MADNTQLVIPSSGTTNQDVVRDLDRGGGIKTQVVQLDVGGVSANAESLVSATNPLPVSGTVTVGNASLAVTGTFFPAVQAVKPDGAVWALTGTSANVNVTNASLAVTGTFWQATQPVSGTISLTGILADAAAFVRGTTVELPVGGVVEALQAGLTVAQTRALSLTTAALLRVDGSNVTQPVSGTVTTTPPANASTNVAQVAATALGVPQTFGTAPTGVVIGTSSDLYAAGTRVRSNQTTTAAGAVDVNVVGVLGVTNAITNPGFMALTDSTTKVGVIAATTALKTDLSSVAGTATATAAAGVQKVGIVGGAGTSLESSAGTIDVNIKNIGNSASQGGGAIGIVGAGGAVLDALTTAATAPSHGLGQLVVYQTTVPALTAGQSVAQQSDSTGSTYVITSGRKATYSAATGATATAGTGVVLQITGSATKTVRILRIHVAGFAAAAAQATFKLQRTSVAATAGTSAALTAGKADTNDAAATAVITHWTATGGTTGTTVGGPYVSDSVWLPSSTFAAATGNEADTQWTFGEKGKELTLRGTGDLMTLTCSGTLAASQVWVEWTEE